METKLKGRYVDAELDGHTGNTCLLISSDQGFFIMLDIEKLKESYVIGNRLKIKFGENYESIAIPYSEPINARIASAEVNNLIKDLYEEAF